VSTEPLAPVAIPSTHYGLDKPLVVDTASHARSFLATSAAIDASPITPANAVTAAQAFVYVKTPQSTDVTPGLWLELDRESGDADETLTFTSVDFGCTFLSVFGEFDTKDLLPTPHQWVHTCVSLPAHTTLTGIGFRFDGPGTMAISDFHFGPSCPR